MVKKTVNKKNKCFKCKKIIKDIPFRCKYCRGLFCSKHRLPEDHNCKELERKKSHNLVNWQEGIRAIGDDNKRRKQDNQNIDDIFNAEPYFETPKDNRARKKSKRKSRGGVSLFFFIVIIVSIGVSLYYPSEETSYFSKMSDQLSYDDFSHTSEMHWDHMPITYNYNQVCAEWWHGEYPSKIETALLEISNATNNSITFIKTDDIEPDINFICYKSSTSSPTWGEDTYMTTVAEAESSWFEGSNIYSPGKVHIYKMGGCVNNLRPATLIHETLHLFGLEHTPKTREYMYDAMYPTIVNCAGRISESEVEYLKGIYG